MGFLLMAFNQISNNCGMMHYTSGGQYKVPMVIRGPGGVGRQLGAEHSQRLESYFQSIPGVQLVACSTVANAKVRPSPPPTVGTSTHRRQVFWGRTRREASFGHARLKAGKHPEEARTGAKTIPLRAHVSPRRCSSRQSVRTTRSSSSSTCCSTTSRARPSTATTSPWSAPRSPAPAATSPS